MLELLLPQRCVVCGRGGAQVCPGCLSGLPRLEPPLCQRCGLPTAWPVRRCRRCAGRRLAVTGVFVARGDFPRSLVLVDDVFTSGATANAAASALRKAGARRVDVVTFARVVR